MEKTLKKIYKNTFKKVFPSTGEIVDDFLVRELGDTTRILDLGCGPSSPIGRVKHLLKSGAYILGVDDFAPYIEENKKRTPKIHSDYLKSNIFKIDFPHKSFDAAILLDVIEHFDKKDFLDFLPRLEKIAKKIIVMTPNGYIDQHEYDNNAYQIHRSGWTAKELSDLGFTVYGASGLKFLRGEYGLAKVRPRVIGNILSNMSEPMIKNRPAKAFHLLSVKNTG